MQRGARFGPDLREQPAVLPLLISDFEEQALSQSGLLCGLRVSTGDAGLIPGSGEPPGEGNDSPLWCSCLGNPMDGGAWWASVQGVAKSQTRLSN